MATIEDFIGYAASKDFTKAGDTFSSLMADKMSAALDQEKIKVGGQIYNDMDPEEIIRELAKIESLSEISLVASKHDIDY